jgi:parallel beta-helix repeat protein
LVATTTVTALAVFVGPLASAHAAKPVNVSCGETITADTKLANDLIDCPGDGIVIGADDITLDLNGHTVDGDGFGNEAEDCPGGECDAGIDITDRRRGVTIQNGSVAEFPSGISIERGSDQRLRQLSVARNGDGIDVFLAKDTVVTDSSVHENVFGIWVGRSDRIRIAGNSVSDFAELGGCGIELARSKHVLVTGNSVSASDPGAPIAGETCGVFVGFGSAHNQIERNSVSGNGFVGVIVGDGDNNDLTANHIFSNADAMIVHGDANIVSGNRISDAVGADNGSGFGIVLEAGQRNLLERNVVERTLQSGIRVGIDPSEPAQVHNLVRLNVVRDARVDGIFVDALASDTLLEGNRAEGAGDDGIGVESSSTTLTLNIANQNQDLGIEAVPGVIDGGGNRAAGNGNPLQCTNVLCG